ncbi:MAG: hypothetical protein COB24_08825 [Hyphomicrobiales bacterium]|nr:MAG: hypothetical protein COB24_08825 [Hyphomicrobiales bacterium]
MASNDNVKLGIDITADPSKAETSLLRLVKSTEGAGLKMRKIINGMFDISASSGEFRGQVRAAAATTRKYATATELARNEISNLRKQFINTSLSATIFNRAMSAQVKIISDATARARLHNSVLGRLRNQIKGLTVGHYALGAAVATAFAVRGIKNQLDGASSIRTQIKLIVGEYGNVNATMRQNFELAKKTYGSLDSTVSAYARISRSTRQLNKSEKERLQVVSNINKSISIGSKTAQEGANAVLQLGQGLSSDRLSGDELKSILENAPRLAQAIADGMDVSIGKLREMGAAGELTAARVFDALYGQTAKIDAEFLNVEKRIDQAMTGVGNSVTLVAGQLDKLYGISQTVVSGFDSMADAIEGIPQYIDLIEFGFAGVAGMITASLIPAVIAIGAAVAASPLLPLILAGGAAALAINLLSEALGGAVDLSARLSDADMRLAKTTDIATQAQYGLTRALRQRGRELATQDVSTALVGRDEAQTSVTSLREEMVIQADYAVDNNMSASALSEWQSELKNKLALANKDLKKATSQYDDSMKNLRKIDSAKIIDFSGDLGKDAGKGAGGELSRVLTNKVNEMTQLLRSVETPLEVLNREKHEFLQKLDLDDQSDRILYDKLMVNAQKRYDAAVKAQNISGNGGGGIKSIFEEAKAAAVEYGEVVDTVIGGVKDTFKSVFSEIFKNGEITMKSLADTVNNMMNRIFDKISGLAIDGLFELLPIGLKDGGFVQSFAGGGGVHGAGTGTSDSIAARLSDGEFVVNAGATAKYRGLLEQINSGNKIAFASQNAANQNINIATEPVVNVSVVVNNTSSAGVSVRQNGNDIEIDIVEVIENGLVKRMADGESNLAAAIASGF